jgi:type IV pilus assembly protein PilE
MNSKSNYGFTLVELMIVVAIIGILAAVAYPSYVESTRKAKRTDAHTSLSKAATLQEREYTQNNAYSAVIADIGGATSTEGYYTISTDITACTASCYSLSATPVTSGAQATDTDCWTLTLDHTGRKTSKTKAGVLNAAGTCW